MNVRTNNYVCVAPVFVSLYYVCRRICWASGLILLHSVCLSFGKHIIKKKDKECTNSGVVKDTDKDYNRLLHRHGYYLWYLLEIKKLHIGEKPSLAFLNHIHYITCAITPRVQVKCTFQFRFTSQRFFRYKKKR